MIKHQRSLFLSVFAVFLSLMSPRFGHAQTSSQRCEEQSQINKVLLCLEQ
jgi:hypothetical protein